MGGHICAGRRPGAPKCVPGQGEGGGAGGGGWSSRSSPRARLGDSASWPEDGHGREVGTRCITRRSSGTTHPSQSSSSCLRKSPGVPGHPRGPQEEVLRHTVEQMADVCPCSFKMLLCRRWGISCWRSSGFWTMVPEQVIDVPKISQDRIQQPWWTGICVIRR